MTLVSDSASAVFSFSTMIMGWVHLYIYPMLTTLTLWGTLTFGMLWLNRRKKNHRRLVLVVTMGILILAHHQLWIVRNDMSVAGVYRAFIASILIWSWHELAFYSGVLTGPWRANCPPDAQGLQRTRYALATHWHHIAAVSADLLLLFSFHHNAPNKVGLYTFALFWLLQLSAKLNVLLGVRNFQASLLPVHMRYLASFWKRRPHNLFLFSSIIGIMILAGVLWINASMENTAGQAISLSLIASVASLGAIEHLMLVLPASVSQETCVEQRETRVAE